MSVVTVLSFILVGALWGCTTPFIKRGASANKINAGNSKGKMRWKRLLGPLGRLTNIEAGVPFLLNQLGSLVYYHLLGTQDISMAVPVGNSLSFFFTAATAMWLGEKTDHPIRHVAGMVLVLVGIAICVASKAR